VRLSGPGALELARGVFRLGPADHPGSLPETPTSHHAYYGRVLRADGEPLDDCLLTWFRAPHSYTGEEVVELSCHGSNLVLAHLLRRLIALGARLAEPGEFSRRAFLNGRLDLVAAEAVADIIHAQTDAALRVAVGQREGRLSRRIAAMRGELIALLAEIEAGIDFPDEIDPPEDRDVEERADRVRSQCWVLLDTADAGRLYRRGAALVLAGRPNVGKSSLLNALLGEERAIVAPTPGTTRDSIEELLSLRGIPVRAIDTAGLREAADAVEAKGVERTRRQLASADLVIWVVDASEGLTVEDTAAAGELPPRCLVAVNKIDLGDRLDAGSLTALVGDTPRVVRVSARTGAGVAELEDVVAAVLLGGEVTPGDVAVNSAHQEQRLRAAIAALDLAVDAAAAGFDQAAVALDLRRAAEALGQIVGESVVESTITEIFARFCVGK
jgi:tRNA modification GTPase